MSGGVHELIYRLFLRKTFFFYIFNLSLSVLNYLFFFISAAIGTLSSSTSLQYFFSLFNA